MRLSAHFDLISFDISIWLTVYSIQLPYFSKKSHISTFSLFSLKTQHQRETKTQNCKNDERKSRLGERKEYKAKKKEKAIPHFPFLVATHSAASSDSLLYWLLRDFSFLSILHFSSLCSQWRISKSARIFQRFHFLKKITAVTRKDKWLRIHSVHTTYF